MDWQRLIIDVLDSNAVMTLIATVGVYLAGKLFASKPEVKVWVEKYKGTIISGIKQAENLIPDDTDNKSLKRLDRALQYTVDIIEKAENRKLTGPELAEVTNNINSEHDALGY